MQDGNEDHPDSECNCANCMPADTRYGAGVGLLYARVIGVMSGTDPDVWYERALDFIDKNSEWHEDHRWNFEFHPDFLTIFHKDRKQE